ncbi:MAG TPA: TRAP transporter TatT component family protein [Vicinamibacterales bacterium]|nr:TRAP transporter TatT component family protein [Vicinamibacterales bacterium]
MRVLLCAVAVAFIAQRGGENPDEVYRHREDLSMAAHAADLWAARAAADFESAWKLARACYWLGRHLPQSGRRAALERGISAGETAIRLNPQRPEGHYWLAADMGRLAETEGMWQGIKYRGRIRSELERVVAIDPAWSGGAGDEALGEWYATVPRLFGGSDADAEAHLRRALDSDGHNLSALVFLGEFLLDRHRATEADGLLRRALSADSDPEWQLEDRELRAKAQRLLDHIY